MHDNFLRVVRTEGSLKPFMYRHSPAFQAQARERGVDPAAYWNLSDPETGPRLVNGFASLPDNLRSKFESKLAAMGLSTEEMQADPDLCRVMSDQIVSVGQQLYQELHSSLVEPQAVVQKLISQGVKARQAEKPAKAIKPIKSLLVSLNLVSVEAGWSEVCDRMEDPEVITLLTDFYESKHQQASRDVLKVKELLPDENPHLVMAGRVEDDLYAADWTRDCTAYHLANGFNAWTVPNWLANPNMNMLYAVDGGALIAKLTTLLAIDQDGSARIIVDSLETSKYITDDKRALVAIRQAFGELQAWADRQGLGDVMVCTYTNSGELMGNLPITPQADDAIRTLAPLSGQAGLQEVGDNLTSHADFSTRVYLQSESDDEEQQEEWGLATPLSVLELHITDAADKLSEANRTKYYRIAQSGDWNKFLKAYLR